MTPSGISTTVSAGLETPDMIELRKRKTQIESDMESMGGETPALYKILPEKAASVGTSMMGSSKVYDISAAKKANLLQEAMLSGTASSIDMSLNPEDMDTDAVPTKPSAEDEEEVKKQQKKKQQQAKAAASSNAEKDKNKKYKEFKF